MPPIIRPATRDDVKAYAPDKLAPTLRGCVMELDGEIVAIAGIARLQSRWRAFVDLKPEARRYKFHIARTAIRFLNEARRAGIKYIYAEIDPCEPSALAWVTSLGFSIDPRSGYFYRWEA
jgi:hypothetical protein